MLTVWPCSREPAFDNSVPAPLLSRSAVTLRVPPPTASESARTVIPVATVTLLLATMLMLPVAVMFALVLTSVGSMSMFRLVAAVAVMLPPIVTTPGVFTFNALPPLALFAVTITASLNVTLVVASSTSMLSTDTPSNARIAASRTVRSPPPETSFESVRLPTGPASSARLFAPVAIVEVNTILPPIAPVVSMSTLPVRVTAVAKLMSSLVVRISPAVETDPVPS